MYNFTDPEGDERRRKFLIGLGLLVFVLFVVIGFSFFVVLTNGEPVPTVTPVIATVEPEVTSEVTLTVGVTPTLQFDAPYETAEAPVPTLEVVD